MLDTMRMKNKNKVWIREQGKWRGVKKVAKDKGSGERIEKGEREVEASS